jgi:hypothetical protein
MVSPSIANFNILFSHLNCSITHAPAYDPVECPCGHLFDRPAIVAWIGNGPDGNYSCPVSRNFLTTHYLRTDQLARAMLAALNVIRPLQPVLDDVNTVQEVGTQTVDAAADAGIVELFHHSTQSEAPTMSDFSTDDIGFNHPRNINSSVRRPVIIAGDDLITVAELDVEQLAYLGGDRFWCLHNGMTNPESHNLDDILDFVVARNVRFLRTLDLPTNFYVYVAIRKYVYQHRSDDLTDVAHHLITQGYFVFDLFRLSRSNGLNKYILYSLDCKTNYRPNLLSRYTRFNN